MQIRVKNLNKGQRGLYVNQELVFVGGGDTSTFTGASADERDAAAKREGLKVQSRLGQDGDWTDHFQEEMPEEKPWFALASDMSGNNFKPLPDLDGKWIIGMAVAGERPDSSQGYKWFKVGGDMEAVAADEAAPVPVEPVVEPEAVEPIADAPVDEPVKPVAAEPVDEVTDPEPAPGDEYAELVKGTMPDVIAAITADNANAIGKAEESRDGGPRKGVMKAVEEAMA